MLKVFRNVVVALLAVIAFAGCARDAKLELTSDQRAVVKAAEDYAAALGKGDYEAMWNLLSIESQEWVVRQLEGDGGLRQSVINQARALESPSLPAEERKRIEIYLRGQPTVDELKEMRTGRQYYVWRLKQTTTDTQKAETARLFSFENVREVVVSGNSATLVLKAGEPDRYTFSRDREGWKLGLPPSRRKELEANRQKEHDEAGE